MNAVHLLSTNRAESAGTILVRQQLLQSFRDTEYRHAFVSERLRASVALQIRALRQARVMTQKELGDAIGMAQTWVSKLENPEYGKMTVATLLRLAEKFDTDLEIKFRPFSKTLDSLPTQGPEYFAVPSFDEEFGSEKLAPEDLQKVEAIEKRLRAAEPSGDLPKKPIGKAASAAAEEQGGNSQGSIGQDDMAIRYAGTKSSGY
jgi:transcriptional regulator with XRE-family HTH domain